MKAEYQTITFADITLSAAAQQSISLMQMAYKVTCGNLDKVALQLCENYNVDSAFQYLELIHAVLLSRDLIYKIGIRDEDDE